MATNTNTPAKTDEAIVGTVLPPLSPSGLSLVPPASDKARSALAAETRQEVGVALDKAQQAAAGIVARLVLLLTLAPVTKDGMDAIKALGGKITFQREDKEGNLLFVGKDGKPTTTRTDTPLTGEVAIPSSAQNKARLVHALVQRTGASDTESAEYKGAVALAEQRGAKAVETAFNRKQPATVRKVLAEIGSTGNMKDRGAIIADKVPTQKRSTGGSTKVTTKEVTRGQARANEVKEVAAILKDAEKRIAALLKGDKGNTLTKTQRAAIVAAVQGVTATVAPATSRQVK